MNLYVLTQSQATQYDSAALGGKAYNLAKLTALGFNVPTWFVVTSHAIDLLLTAPDISSFIDTKISLLSSTSSVDDIGIVANEIQEQISTLRIPEEIINAMSLGLESLGMANQLVSVRSLFVNVQGICTCASSARQ